MRLLLFGLAFTLSACATNAFSERDTPTEKHRIPAAERGHEAKCDYLTEGPGPRANMRVGGEERKNLVLTYENCIKHVYEFMKEYNRDTAIIRFLDSRERLIETKISAQ